MKLKIKMSAFYSVVRALPLARFQLSLPRVYFTEIMCSEFEVCVKMVTLSYIRYIISFIFVYFVFKLDFTA